MAKRRPSTHFVTSHYAAHHWPRRTGMPSAFTAFVRSLRGVETPDADLFHDVWHGLRDALASEMKKRGLWHSPPRYLGVCGWERWDCEEPTADPRAPAWGTAHAQVSALGELVADCYAFIFVERLPSLKRHLEDKPDIHGLVLLNIRHFLHERQRAHDPLGFRVFELLHTAVGDAVSCGALHVLAGDTRVRNDTVLGFVTTAEPQPAPDLGPIAVRWNDELLPALTARNYQQAVVAERLRRRLLELSQQGVEAFRFKDLLEPLRSDARLRWAALLGEEGGQSSDARSRPSTSIEARQSFEHLDRCVSASILGTEADPRTRTQLSVLWSYLWRQQGGDEDGERPASYRQLAERLKIPRERFPRLFTTLRQLVARSRTDGGAT
jgi:hypothetical protein